MCGFYKFQPGNVLIFVNKRAVFAHKLPKVYTSYRKSSYLCIVKRHKG